MSQLRDGLRHVLWLGGPPDSGKTSVADRLAAKHGLPVYHFDRHERSHISRADPVRHPELHRLTKWLAPPDAYLEARWLDEAWVEASPETLCRETITSWTERVGLALEDLREMATTQPIIAEGPGFFPDAILPVLSEPRRAIWLVASESFRRDSHTRRDKTSFRHATSDPERALRNHAERDRLLAAHYRRSLDAHGLPYIEVDGSSNVEELAAKAEACFAPFLTTAEQGSGC